MYPRYPRLCSKKQNYHAAAWVTGAPGTRPMDGFYPTDPGVIRPTPMGSLSRRRSYLVRLEVSRTDASVVSVQDRGGVPEAAAEAAGLSLSTLPPRFCQSVAGAESDFSVVEDPGSRSRSLYLPWSTSVPE